MAEEEKKEADPTVAAEAAPKRKKKGLLLGGGVIGLVAGGYILSLAAIPSAPEEMSFEGPHVVELSPEQVQVNLSGEGGKRFLVMTLQAEYDSYEVAYATARVADTLYQAKLKDALIRVARKKSKSDLDDPIGEEIFKEEVRGAVDPLLFPVHVGNPGSPTDPDPQSGIRAGRSNARATMRGGFHAHELIVDGPARTIRLDGGSATEFEGTETDLELFDATGASVFVDLTGLDPEFSGEVPTGTFGHVRQVYFGKFLVQ